MAPLSPQELEQRAERAVRLALEGAGTPPSGVPGPE